MGEAADRRLRHRRWKGDAKAVRFPAWRAWSDSRVRLDDAMLDALAGMRLARVALDERSTDASDRVPKLFTDAELPFKGGFDVSVEVAHERLADAESQLTLNAFPIYVSGFDDLLGDVIRMLRRLGIGVSKAAMDADKGVSAKVAFLEAHCGLTFSPPLRHLYTMLVEIRHAVIHDSASDTKVRAIWERDTDPAKEARALWIEMTTRALPAPFPDGTLDLSDREVIGCQRTLDRLGLDLARALRERILPVDWARLVADEHDSSHRAVLADPKRGTKKLQAWSFKQWGVTVTTEEADEARASPLPKPR
jgi:hypothetical protein